MTRAASKVGSTVEPNARSARSRGRVSPRTLLAVLIGLMLLLIAVITPAVAPRVRHRWAVETLRGQQAWLYFDDAKAIAEAQRTGNYHVWHEAQGNWWLDVVTVQFG